MIKFSRLLYKKNYDYVIEFEVNGELKLWYSTLFYQGWDKPSFFNEELSDQCILQNQIDLVLLFFKSPITHFEKDLPNVENTMSMFSNCKYLIYFRSKMSNTKHTKGMFKGCSEEFFQNHPYLIDL